MAWADKAKSGQGGAIEGAITDYTFMDRFPFGDEDEKNDNNSIFMLLEIQPDGEDAEPVKRSFYLGSGEYLRIEEDGKTLVSSDDDGTPKYFSEGDVAKYIDSLEAAGFPAVSKFPDPEEDKVLDFRGMIGWRIRLSSEVDEEATKKFGKKKVKSGKHKGKEFNRTYYKVTKVNPPADDAKAAKGAKASGKASEAKASKASKPAKDDDDDDAASLSNKEVDAFLKGLLKGQKGKPLAKSDLALSIARYARTAGIDNSDRDAMRQFLVADEFSALEDAAERGVIEISKKGITLSE